MTNPTSNFGWQMPTPTDLVTDLPADFEVFGQAVDTSMADLKGGTTGQILSKATNTDMDFTWITNDVGDITNIAVTSPITGGGSSGSVTIGVNAASTSASGVVQLSDSTSTTSSVLASTPTATKSAYDLAAAAVPKSTVTTAGDVIYATGSSAVSRLGIGTAGQVLTVNSGATAPQWSTPAAGGTWTQVGTGALSGASVTISGLSGKALMLSIENWKSSSISYLGLQLNGDTANNYVPTSMDLAAVSFQLIMSGTKATTDGGYGSIFMPNAGTATQTKMVINGNYGGIWASSATISSIKIYPSAGSFNAGFYYIWSQS